MDKKEELGIGLIAIGGILLTAIYFSPITKSSTVPSSTSTVTANSVVKLCNNLTYVVSTNSSDWIFINNSSYTITISYNGQSYTLAPGQRITVTPVPNQIPTIVNPCFLPIYPPPSVVSIINFTSSQPPPPVSTPGQCPQLSYSFTPSTANSCPIYNNLGQITGYTQGLVIQNKTNFVLLVQSNYYGYAVQPGQSVCVATAQEISVSPQTVSVQILSSPYSGCSYSIGTFNQPGLLVIS
ncbi:hypothetical protein SBV1_gp33 [Sulfolobales Beppu virus 1]|nr:hypothetical protein SBV1_gp33 [Sulfolobales Beppu virus 1]